MQPSFSVPCGDRQARLLRYGLVAGLLGLGVCVHAQPAAAIRPIRGLEEVSARAVTLQGGFWGPRLQTHHKITIPHVLDQLEQAHHLANFDVAAKVVGGGVAVPASESGKNAVGPHEGDVGGGGLDPKAGLKEGGIIGHHAFDSDLHKALEGACYTLGYADDPALRGRVEGMLERIVAAQQDDGYLVSYFIAKEPQNRWADLRTNHEMYNAGHLFEFAVAHHQLESGDKALVAAKRFADHIDRTFGAGKRYDVDGHQEVELALVRLYRATGEKRYLDLCRFFLEERGHAHGLERKPFVPGPFVPPARAEGLTDQQYERVVWRAKLYWRNGRMQDHKPVLQQTEAVGHAVRACYMYAAMADLARFSEAPEYGEAARTLWQDVVGRKMYLTGGLGTAQYGDEGFGDPYRLPNRTYCESCASIAHVLWQHRMNLLFGDARYADVMELTLYNSALSGMTISGNQFFYQNPLESREGAERRKWIGLACCPTNLARFTPQVGGFMYAVSGKRIDVNLYAAGEAEIPLTGGSGFRLIQETHYPWDGRILIRVDAKAPLDAELRLRIPGWALGKPVPSDLYRYESPASEPVSLKLNTEPLAATPDRDGYVAIQRVWSAGDRIELILPMPVRRVLSHEKIEGNRGRVALMRGPLVYCFEGVDQAGVDLFQVALPKTGAWSAIHRPDLLGGVTVIEGVGRDAQGKEIRLSAIPYHAWANRGKTPMNLWMTDGP
ncbi:MAG TPA: beta-L-arabinofuranosidase domain-containing protein [Luteolibacter sp.]|nr:beta-L-arabinofuranosidase domain-containing protein [Luteolibacter sp.]